ncbi:hypothetical protein FNV43_RR08459 [Rhamnella rubrinervis]|uniref:Uncharacterized protein n=1 Tax=Rhamnella rubrinervis TaxID=2594499 RepID=A0A8K0MIY9_9ROSA|nr:hypothetical protein FNV43_RR08459 [Rhamnella rubrinervis]
MSEFLQLELYDTNGLSLMVQVTFFHCGGMAIGVGLHHQDADALSFIMFLNSWSELARGQTDFNTPIFGGSELFLPQDMSTNAPSSTRYVHYIRITKFVKRFVFDASKIATLVNKYSDDSSSAAVRLVLGPCLLSYGAASWLPPDRKKPKFTTPLPSFETNYKDGCYINIVSTTRDAIKQINPEFDFNNKAIDTKYGDGIEAWVNLEEEDMAKFEADEEVLAMFPWLP